MKNYFQALIPLVIAFAIYHWGVAPIIEPRVEFEEKQWTQVTPTKTNRWWESQFAVDSWQVKSPKKLETTEGVLLFENSEQLTDDSFRFWPLTIIVSRGSIGSESSDPTKSDSPILIDAPKGARIQFRDSFNWSAGKPPPIQGGKLEGEVRIVGQPTSPDADDGILIQTRELFIDKRVIRTTTSVRAEIGNSIIEGRDLAIFLDQDLLGDGLNSNHNESGTLQQFDGIDRMELNVVQRVHIDLPGGSLWSDSGEGNPNDNLDQPLMASDLTNSPNNLSKPNSAWIDLKCNGAFRFDFHSLLASLSGGVNVVHQSAGAPVDKFDSDSLQLQFAMMSESTSSEKMTLSRISAEGRRIQNQGELNKTKWVLFDLPGMKSRGQARRLEIDLIDGRVFLSNRLPNQRTPETIPVYLQREKSVSPNAGQGMRSLANNGSVYGQSKQTIKVWAPDLEFISQEITLAAQQRKRNRLQTQKGQPSNSTAVAKGQSNEYEALGEINASGPGQLHLESSDDNWKLSWRNRLLLRPVNGEDQLTITGGTHASSQRQGEFWADHLNLWLKRTPEELTKRMRQQNGDSSPPAVIPDRMYATGTVQIRSPKLTAAVEELKAWFEFPISDSPANAANNNAGQLNLAESRGNFDARSISQGSPPGSTRPTLSVGTGNTAGSNRDSNQYSVRQVTDSKPVSVTGKSLQTKLVYTDSDMLIDDLTINGGITMTLDSLSQSQDIPLTLQGDSLRMNTADAGSADVQMIGSPALIRMGSGSLEGPEVRFNQRDHLAWIPHPGRFKIPVELIEADSPGANGSYAQSATTPNLALISSPNKTASKWVDAPVVHWSGSMQFDGQRVKLAGGVNVEGRMQIDDETLMHFAVNSDLLTMDLTEPIQMSPTDETTNEFGRGSEAAKPRLMMLDRNVDMRTARTDLQGNRLSIERIVVPRIEINLLEETFFGHGPGWVRSRHRNRSSQALSGDSQLQCAHLTFVGQMQGHFDRRQIAFQQRVEALIGPIATFSDLLDVTQISNLSSGQSWLTCDELVAYSTDSLSWNSDNGTRNSENFEVEARGKVSVLSDQPSGQASLLADRIVYTAERDEVRILGTAQRPATMELTRRNAPDQGTPRLQVTSAIVDLNTMEPRSLQLVEATSGTPVGTSAFPSGVPAGSGNGPASSYDWQRDSRGGGGPIQSPREQFPRRRGS